MRVVPQLKAEFIKWRDKALLYRAAIRAEIENDPDFRTKVLTDCQDDPAYDMLLFGVILEPRDRSNRVAGWYPMIPYPFQVDLVRWIQEIEAVKPGSPEAALGRGDGILEKARGMTGSFTFAYMAAHHWRYFPVYLCGFVSYKEEAVENGDDPGSIFYKIEAQLGINNRVPAYAEMILAGQPEQIPLRAPAWMVPEGWENKYHNGHMRLVHPSKTCVISGMTTTDRIAVGFRFSTLYFDEAAKYGPFGSSWHNTTAASDHRIAGSSPDVKYGQGFKDLAKHAEKAQRTGIKAPSFMRLKPSDHPEQDDVWRDELEARHQGVHGAVEALAREYDLDYESGGARYIYPFAKSLDVEAVDYSPVDDDLDFCIDPGIDDFMAFHFVRYNRLLHEWGVVLSYAKAQMEAEFHASLYVGKPLAKYRYGEEEHRVMEFTRKHRKRVRYLVGDPTGRNRSQGTGKSFYQEFQESTELLTNGAVSAVIWSSYAHDHFHLEQRHAALRWMLPNMVFNDSPDVEFTLKSIQEHRWKFLDYEKETTSVPQEPVRTPGHDRVTALEFYAAHQRMDMSVTNVGVAEVTKMGTGKILQITGGRKIR